MLEYKLYITMTPNTLCDLPRHQQQPTFFAAWIRRGIVDNLGWCCSRPSVQSFWTLQLKLPIRDVEILHLRPTVFFWDWDPGSLETAMPCHDPVAISQKKLRSAPGPYPPSVELGENLSAIFLPNPLWTRSLLLVTISKRLELQGPSCTRSQDNLM